MQLRQQSQGTPAPVLPSWAGTAQSAAAAAAWEPDTAEEQAEEQQWALTLFVQPRGKRLGCTSGADAATASHPQPHQMGDHSLWALSPDHNPPSHHFTENFFSLC